MEHKRERVLRESSVNHFVAATKWFTGTWCVVGFGWYEAGKSVCVSGCTKWTWVKEDGGKSVPNHHHPAVALTDAAAAPPPAVN